MFIGMSLDLTGQLLASVSPVALFAGGEVGVWYDPSDLTTLYQDSAGTTPVTAPAQTVGLMLDKSQGLVLGSELITNGDFATDTIWTKGTGWTISGGVATKTAGTASNLYQPIFATDAAAKNKITVITLDTTVTAGSFTLSSGGYNVSPTVTASGSYLFRITASEPSSDRNFYVLASAAFAGTIDNVSVKELMGNHAVQATSAQRPTYGINPIVGTRNLFLYSQEFDNNTWAKQTSATVVANAGIAPDGTNTADQVNYSSNSISAVYQDNSVVTASGTLTMSVWAQCASGTEKFRFIVYNATNGQIDGPDFTVTTTWQRFQATFTVSAASAWYISNASDGLVRSILIWGAQLELGSTATDYQKVVSQYEVTEAGVQSVSYLRFDGVDDGMVTNTITPAIDKAQVFVGVRKLSDAANGMLFEYSENYGNFRGTLGVFLPTSGLYNALLYGGSTGATTGADTSVYSAPITNVLQVSYDTTVAQPNEIKLRVNSVNDNSAPSTAEQTGNFLAYPLYIGRRGGSTFPYNGRLYSLILRFGANLTDGQITSTESWVNSKTGAY